MARIEHSAAPHTAFPRRLEKYSAILVIVDMQERFRDIIQDGERVTSACGRLIRYCRALDIPVVVTEHYPRGLGVTLPELRRLFDPFRPIEKITFSCCGSGEFNDAIDRLDRDQVILCGIESHVCVYQTAFDLLRKGKQVALATDAISARRRLDLEIGLKRMAELGAQSMGAEQIMFEILKKAKTDDFQLVSSILKE